MVEPYMITQSIQGHKSALPAGEFMCQKGEQTQRMEAVSEAVSLMEVGAVRLGPEVNLCPFTSDCLLQGEAGIFTGLS